MKIKFKNKLICIVVIMATLMNFGSVCFANLTQGDVVIESTWSGETPYEYNGENKVATMRTCNGNPVYTKEIDNNGGSFLGIELKPYENEKIKNILKKGYGARTKEELNCIDDVEAFLATQEAIYMELGYRIIDGYVAHEEKGERILKATRKILDDAFREGSNNIKIVEEDKYWKDYELNKEYKCKKFSIKSKGTINGKIEIVNDEDAKIVDANNVVKQTFIDNDTFYLVVAKNLGQGIRIRLSYEKQSVIAYTCKQSTELKDNYILSEQQLEKLENEFDISIYANSIVKIVNQDKETKMPIQGSVFSIIRENGLPLKENLTTNEKGEIETELDIGKYYLKQTGTIDGYSINKAVIEINIEKNEPVNIKIESTKDIIEETTNIDKEINMTEENKYITENNIKEISNINTTNINKEIINQTNETNLHNVNNFINTINRKNIVNLQKENTYRNYIEEEVVQNKILTGEDKTLNMTRRRLHKLYRYDYAK